MAARKKGARRKAAGTINKNAQKQLDALEPPPPKPKKKSGVTIWPKYTK